jgi:hypothetical protein
LCGDDIDRRSVLNGSTKGMLKGIIGVRKRLGIGIGDWRRGYIAAEDRVGVTSRWASGVTR